MQSNTKKRLNVSKIVAFVILTLASILVIIPLLWALVNSLRDADDIYYHPYSFFPTGFDKWTISNYVSIFTSEKYPVCRWVINSLIVATSSSLLYLIIASFAAYAFVFLKLKFANGLFVFLIGTMTIPGIVLMVPQYSEMYSMGLNKTLLGLILPGLGGVYGLFLIRQFFLSIPYDLIESSRADGAKDFTIFTRIVLPLGKSIILVQGLFGFLGAWNDLVWAQIIVGQCRPEMWTLSLGLSKVIEGTQTYENLGLQLACTIIAMVPIAIMYLFVQKRIVEGVAMTGIKR